jgi:hypothetical protein
MPRLSIASAPDFQLSVIGGKPHHLPAHGGRFFQIEHTTTSATTLQFNGTNSRLEYDATIWPELALRDEWTMHVRLRLDETATEPFIAGRYGLNFVTAPAGWPQGNFCNGPQCLTPANSRAWCAPGGCYDVVVRFRPATTTIRADTRVEVFDGESGELMGRNHPLPRAFDQILFARDDAPFTIGQAGDYAAFAGEIAELSVWNRWIDLPKQASVAERGVFRSLPVQLRSDLADKNARERWTRWRNDRDTFPLAAWGYFHRYAATVAEYTLYRDAGLMLVMTPTDSAERAETAGLDPVIGLWQDNGDYAELYKHPDRLDAHLRFAREKLHRCAGYMLADEPRFNGPGIAELAPGFQEIYSRDSSALPMVNLMTYAYNMGGGFSRYIEDVIRINHPPFLVADSYVLYADGTSNDDQFYANTEIVRQKALQAGIGFMGFALVTGHRRRFPEHSFRTASESDLHWQVNTLLAYGAQGIWYYNYRIGGEGFDEAFVTHVEGKPTASFERIRKLNRGILAQSKLLLSLQSKAIYHVRADEDFLPEFGVAYHDGCIDGLLALEGSGLLIGELVGPASDRYLMIVNKRHAANRDVTAEDLQTTVNLQFSSTLAIARLNHDAVTTDPISDGHVTLSLGGGERALLRLRTS